MSLKDRIEIPKYTLGEELVPAISKKMLQWSIILNTLFALLTFKEWYIVDIVYKIIDVVP